MVDIVTQNGGPAFWNPTSPREAHEDVLIRSDLPLMCKNIFPPLRYALEDNKTIKGMGLKANNIYIVGVGSL